MHSVRESPTDKGGGGCQSRRQELIIEQQLHEALEAGGFSLLYQPIVNPLAGQVETCEALMRCQVQGQQLMPDQFIPVAEKTGQIIQLGDWSLLAAAQTAEQLAQHGYPTRIAVNISRTQLTAPQFQHTLQTLLTINPTASRLIEIELTESLFMDTSHTVRSNLAAAVEAGFSLAIDDFGTGYSCLAYLKDIPASKLKLDRTFIQGLPADHKSLSIIRAITQMAHDLGISVVAEGVENVEQCDILLNAGVNMLQGFLFSRPLSASRLETWLTTFKDEKI